MIADPPRGEATPHHHRADEPVGKDLSRHIDTQLVGIVRPSGLKAREKTSFVCPWNRATSWPVVRSQSQMARSRPADTSRLPSGWKTAEKTESVCPVKTATQCAAATSQTRIVRYSPAEASKRPSAPNATEFT